MEFNTKTEFKGAIIGFIGFLIIFNLIIWLQLSLLQIIGLLMIYNLVKTLALKEWNFKKYLISCFYTTVIVSIAYYIIEWFGFIGLVITIISIVILLLYSKRKKYFAAKHKIESMIWGKPLKNFKQEGKKPPKIKFKL